MDRNFYNNFFYEKLNQIKSENRYRVFNHLEKNNTSYPFANLVNDNNKKEIIIWCSNDYLGMSQKKSIIDAAKKSLSDYGTGSGGTRNISGTHLPLIELEKEIALLHKKENALAFTSGYVANESTISSLIKLFPSCVVFSDQQNHASIISGLKKSYTNKIIFPHNDISALEKKISSIDYHVPKIIIFESIYSMDGTLGKIREIVSIAKKYNALTYIDEVHAVGMYGQTGGGISEELGIQKDIDILQGTLAKAYGNIGGYIASNKLICDYIRSTASGFIFTTSLPPSVTEAAKNAIQYLKLHDNERNLQKENVKFLKNKLTEYKINFFQNKTHIVPVMINDADKCTKVSQFLLNNYGHYIQPINYPTVPKGTERLRITPGPLHTKKMITDLVKSLKETIDKINLTI